MRPNESFVEVAGGKVQMLKGGSGWPLLILHHDVGHPGWLPFYDDLARDFTVHVPSHPGFGKSERPEWMRTVRDMALVYQWLLADMKLDALVAVGLGFGGWIASEIAMMCRHAFQRMALVNPMGMLPRRGEILDQFLITRSIIRAAASATRTSTRSSTSPSRRSISSNNVFKSNGLFSPNSLPASRSRGRTSCPSSRMQVFASSWVTLPSLPHNAPVSLAETPGRQRNMAAGGA